MSTPVSYDLSQTGNNVLGGSFYQQISDNGQPGTGGNGIDVVVYAGNGLPLRSTPDSGST